MVVVEGVKVFVLTNARTFSGGEEIAYNLQALKRAVVVGERTIGGAHHVDVYQVHPHFDMHAQLRAPSTQSQEQTGKAKV